MGSDWSKAQLKLSNWSRITCSSGKLFKIVTEVKGKVIKTSLQLSEWDETNKHFTINNLGSVD